MGIPMKVKKKLNNVIFKKTREKQILKRNSGKRHNV